MINPFTGVAIIVASIMNQRNASKLREVQEKIAAEARDLQCELHKQSIQTQKELAEKNHLYKLEELDYLNDHKNWPLQNPPKQTRRNVIGRGWQTLTVFVAPLATSQNKAGGTIPSELTHKQQALDQSLRHFLDAYYHRGSDRPVYYMDEAWPQGSPSSGESAVASLSDWLKDLPVLVLQPCAVGNEITEIRFWFWDVGIPNPDYGSFRLSNLRGKATSSLTENPETLSRIYQFLVAAVADWRLLAQSGVMPYFPTVCQSWRKSLTENDGSFVLDAWNCAMTGYEKVIVGIAKNDLDEALRICNKMKSDFEALALDTGVARMNDCIRKISPARPKKAIGNIKDYVSQFGT